MDMMLNMDMDQVSKRESDIVDMMLNMDMVQLSKRELHCGDAKHGYCIACIRLY